MEFNFKKNAKNFFMVLMAIGVVTIIAGFLINPHRTWSALLVNDFYFLAIALCGTFFVAVNTIAQAGWAVGFRRVPEAMGTFILFGGIGMILIFLFGHHDLYQWTHAEYYNKFLAGTKTPNPDYDKILDGKKGFLNVPFFTIRMIAYILIWVGFTRWIRKESLAEDLDGGIKHYDKSIKIGAIYIVLFGITSSTAAWDFIMSIDAHWFSTLFGWYIFAGLFVSGLAAMCLLIIYLKSLGHYGNVNENHLHDVGKFMFAFSIFWTYLWFSQFMLYWYANLPEEVTYTKARWDHYRLLFWVNFFINFVFPFLVLMTRDAKRKIKILLIAGTAILIGHWIDVYLMVMPGTIGRDWNGFNLIEFGILAGYAGAFLFVVFTSLAKAPLIAKNHPLLKESIAHHI
jgi:hypothetical protein